ncbi:MAG TPA: homoserine dehydrogenase [Vicinamibacterales bacterium]|nr:homoserine dehydrogenase [Vicinamibacterales bacterium]
MSTASPAANAVDRDLLLRPRVTAARVARRVRVRIAGYGRVGQAVARALESSSVRARLAGAGLDVRCEGALVRRADLARPDAPAVALTTDPGAIGRPGADVIVETLGGCDVALDVVSSALRQGVAVVTANKTLVAAHGPSLRALAAAHRTSFLYDAAVLAGVPCLGWLARRPVVSAARRLTGIVNGTSHYVTCELGRGATFAAALADAVSRGFAEPDSRADISGRDAAEKLTILLHLAGRDDVRTETLTTRSIDVLDEGILAAARDLGGVIKPVVTASLEADDPGAWVGPAFVPSTHPLASLTGVANGIRITIGRDHTLALNGPGAGPDATAVTILDDIAEAATGAHYGSPATISIGPTPCSLGQPPASAWLGVFSSAADDVQAPHATLASLGVPVALALRRAPRWFVLTRRAGWSTITGATEAFRAQGIDALFLPSVAADDAN